MLKTIVATFQTVMGSAHSQQSAVATIHEWRAKPIHELIFESGRRDVKHYFEAVDRLHHPSSSNLKSFNNELISIAIDRLKHEFDAVLRRQADDHPGPISTTESSFTADSTAYLFRFEEYVAYEPPSQDAIDYLSNIAQRVSSNGNLEECVEIYKNVRKGFLQAHLKRLRFDELSSGLNSNRYTWDEQRLKMELWVQVSKICVKILFEREKTLCNQIFQGLNNNLAKDECFVGTVQEYAIALFNFAEAISLSKYNHDKMEKILGVYSSFVWVLPNANALFDCESGKDVKIKCAEILSNIESDVMRLLHDFGKDVLLESSNFSDDQGSAVHRLTEYTMDQIAIIFKNKDLLANLIKSAPSLNFGSTVLPREDLGDINGRSFLDQHLILIIVVLQVKLKTKCQNYKNATLGQLFLMNNVRYIGKKINEGSNGLREMIGEPCFRKLDESFRFAMESYRASTCSKFLACLDDEGLYVTQCCKRPRMSRKAVKRRLNNFNAAYEELQTLHSLWVVPDLELRDDVRVALRGDLVPAYVRFLEKLRSDPEIDLLLEHNMKYSAEEFEALILEKLFADSVNVQ